MSKPSKNVLIAVISALLLFAALAAAIVSTTLSPHSAQPSLPSGVVLTLTTTNESVDVGDPISLQIHVANEGDKLLSLDSEVLRDSRLSIQTSSNSWTVELHSLLDVAGEYELSLPPGESHLLSELVVPIQPTDCNLSLPARVDVQLESRFGTPWAQAEFSVNPSDVPFIAIWTDKLAYGVGETVRLRFYVCNPTDSFVGVGTDSKPEWGFAIFDVEGVNLTTWRDHGGLMSIGNIPAPAGSQVPLPPGMHDTDAFLWKYDVERMTVGGLEFVGSEYEWSQFSTTQGSSVQPGVYVVQGRSFSLADSEILSGVAVFYIYEETL